MKELLVGITILGTIAGSLGLGVGVGYAAIAGILNGFGHRTANAQESAPVLAHSSSSGD
ncbi:MAG TPA: hypothetical protein VFU76_18590 [Terriglobales bacterium]|nr:hypothetical protein [Terriglobales bacterium]